MKRYIIRIHDNCSMGRRREIREPERRELNDRPRPITEVHMPVMPTMSVPAYHEQLRYDLADLTVHSQAFETVCFSTLTWLEEHVEDGVSCGHYYIFDSYFQVPQGVDLPLTELHTEGTTYHDADTESYRGLSGEAYYRVRMLELERQLENLERTRDVLPQEQINDISTGTEEGKNRPLSFEHFDEDIFKMETEE